MEWLFVATYASLLIFIEKYIDLQQELDELKDEKKEKPLGSYQRHKRRRSND